MSVFGHRFTNFKSVEEICWPCGYVIPRGMTDAETEKWICCEERAELHCGGKWHVFDRRPTSKSRKTKV